MRNYLAAVVVMTLFGCTVQLAVHVPPQKETIELRLIPKVENAQKPVKPETDKPNVRKQERKHIHKYAPWCVTRKKNLVEREYVWCLYE